MFGMRRVEVFNELYFFEHDFVEVFFAVYTLVSPIDDNPTDQEFEPFHFAC